METIVNVGSPYGGNTAPVSSIPTIINLPTNQSAATYNFSAIDPDGDPFNFRFATTAESQTQNVTNNGLMTLSNSGAFTFNTSGLAVGSLHSSAIMVEDLDGSNNVKSKVPLDILIEIVGASTPPNFVSPTPASGTVIT